MAQPKDTATKTSTTTTLPATQEATIDTPKRIADNDLRIEHCTAEDAQRIAEIIYECFPPPFWTRKEPPHLSSASPTTRTQRLAKRITPTLLFHPNDFQWIKAVYIPTNEIAGIANWTTPGMPVHIHFRRSASALYGWQDKMNWSDAEVDEMWEHVSDEAWNGTSEKDDALRKELMGNEPHWHLAPLATVPKFQGRGVGGKLLKWAFERADATVPPTPLYLESAPTARGVYMRYGFVPVGEANFVRRGPVGKDGEGNERVERKEVEA
ncbi:acyl-CoA N-acyltransferase [Plenodomus tracheiphilus IPT5]|uniref:Acyl-CoA N-acyltransferase n=1 Tax=Plenodomus tracheiphilus IPT5 TaxID=1408161 RepID=A0A6A7B2H0_9PLEO|nr:acyl-CoA N-acyltransferase [Plenodomus tracheiphilus IPT5]